MQYVPTAHTVSELSKRVVAGIMALTIILSIMVSAVFSATAYAGTEETLPKETTETAPTETASNETTDNKTEKDPTVVDQTNESTDEISTIEEVSPPETHETKLEKNVIAQNVDETCDRESNAAISVLHDECEEADTQTLREIIDTNPQTSQLSDALTVLDEYNHCEVVHLLDHKHSEDITIFLPTNNAFDTLVRSPGNSTVEITELLSNPDELCELISYHISSTKILSSNISASTTIGTFAHDNILSLKKTGNKFFVDQAQITKADIIASNGIAHLINDVLLPKEIGNINAIKTNSSSPALSGTITSINSQNDDEEAAQYCVVVRIDGTPYTATVEHNQWKIKKNVITIDPFKSSTLFDVIVRDCSQSYHHNNNVQSLGENEEKGTLLGLTMVRNILSYKKSIPTPNNNGEVLGANIDKTNVAISVEPVAYSYSSGSSCGKGLCVAADSQNKTSNKDNDQSNSEKDSDGDGVIDSEDSEPNNPDVTGQEDQTNDNDNKNDKKDDSSQAFWWFIGGGGIALLWYLLWQRGGKENL